MLKQDFFCGTHIFKAIAGEIDQIMEMTKKSDTKISTKGAKRKGTTIITINGEDSFTYKVIFNRLQDLIDGEMIESINVSKVSYDLTKGKIDKMEERIGNCKIEYDKRHGKFRIYGNPEKRKLLINGLKKIYENWSKNKEIKIDLKGKGKRPGLMKELMKKYGSRLQNIMPSETYGIVEVNIFYLIHCISCFRCYASLQMFIHSF